MKLRSLFWKKEHALASLEKELDYLKNRNEYTINQKNTAELKNIEDSYLQAMHTYEKLLDLKNVDTASSGDCANNCPVMSLGNYASRSGAYAVIANRPLLVSNGQIAFSATSFEPKENIYSSRGFVGATNNTVYIGVIHNVTLSLSAQVIHALGINNAINLDDGGSSALWFGGYKVGPGRDLPNVILFVRK